MTPIETRADVAYFGTFGYELDLLKLGEEDKAEIRRQIAYEWRREILNPERNFLSTEESV